MYKLPAIYQVHLAAFLFGLPGLSVLSTGLDPVVITFGRTLFAAIALVLLWQFAGRKEAIKFDQWIVLAGLLLAVHWVLFFLSIKVSTVAIGLIMFSISPLFIAVLEPIFFNEPFTARNFLPALVVLAGIAIMMGMHNNSTDVTGGVIWGLGSSLVYAVLQVLNRKMSERHKATSLVLLQNSVACCAVFPFVFLELPSVSASQWLQLVFLGIVCTAFAYSLFISAMQGLSAAVVSLIVAGLEPTYGIALAALVFGQRPDSNVLIGGVIVLATVLYVSAEKSKKSAA